MRVRVAIATSCVLVLSAVTAALVGAQAPPGTVVVNLSPQRVTFEGAEGVAAGTTRIEFRNPSRRAPADSTLVALRPGQTVDDLRRALPRASRGPGVLKSIVTFEAGGSVAPGGTYATTIDLKPGVTYVAASIAEDAEDSALGSFTVGTTTQTAARPAPAATVGVYDYAFGMPATLPRRGTIRFDNRGERLHIAVAFALRRGANRTAAVRALIGNQERRLERLVDGRRTIEPLGVVSGGTVNDVEVDFGRTGNWVFVCFIEDGEPGSPSHNTIGMVKSFRVR